jgi:outer membrane receptor for ferrienterochelin and colicins
VNRAAILVGIVALPLLARADTPAPAPAVDVADLPPLPPAEAADTSSATVLAASAAEEDVVVGAAKREQSLGNVASAVTVVSADRIKRFGYRTVGEAVASVAGVYLEDNRLVGSLGIRGLNIPGDYNTRILVLVDGATVNESWGAFAGLGFDTFVSIDDVARIEVIRGPVSSLYGANAFFGIINIVTRSAAETPRAWGRVSVNSINGVVSSAGFATGDMHRQLRGTVQAMSRFGETVTLPDVGSGLEGDGAYQLAASVVGSYGGTFGQVRAYRQRRDNPFAPYNADPSANPSYSEYNTQLLVEGGHTRELSKRLTFAARGYANIYRFYDHILQLGAAPFDDYGDARTFGAEARVRYDLVPDKVGITTGAEAQLNQTKSRSFQVDTPADAAIVPKDFNIEGVYAEVDGQPTEWLGFTAGLRYDRNSAIDTRLSPRAALFLAKKEKYGAKLLYAEGFRNPSAYEAFFYDNASFEQPKDLKAERIRSFEAVLWAKPVPGLSTRVSGFLWDATGLITQLEDPKTMLLQFQNVGGLRTRGVEVEGSYRTASGWYGFGGGAYASVGAKDTGDYVYGEVPDAPALTAAAGISTPQLAGYVHVSGEVTFIGERPTRDPMVRAPAWTGVNLTAYVPSYRGFDITAGIRNVIGRRNRVVATGDYDRTIPTDVLVPIVPGEGREFHVKVGHHF